MCRQLLAHKNYNQQEISCGFMSLFLRYGNTQKNRG